MGAGIHVACALVVLTSVVAERLAAQGLVRDTGDAAFEVASVKPTTSGPRLPVAQVLPGGQVQIISVTLRALIRLAYPAASGPVDVEQGPSWAENDRFDVIAKSSEGQLPSTSMLRRLLTERFKLRTRVEQREGTMFKLVLARKDGRLGPQLTPATCAPSCAPLRIGAGPSIIGEGVTMPALAAALSNFPVVGGPVADATGLDGPYDLSVRFSAANGPNPGAGPLLPTALEEQLGLKLERGVGLREVVIIDAVERPEPD